MPPTHDATRGRAVLTFPLPLQLLLWVPVIGVWGATVATWPSGDALFLGAVAVIVTLVIGACSVFVVTWDARRVRAFGPLGIPRLSVDVADISAVAETHIDPFADFGGWGLRYQSRLVRGVVVRRGPAVMLTSRQGVSTTFSRPSAAFADAVRESAGL